MNSIERKLYNLICEDKSALKKALSGTVKNSETGNDVKVSSALAYKDSDNPGQKAAYQAAVGALKGAGASEKQIDKIASKGKEKSAEKEPKKPETSAPGQQPPKAEPVKIAAADFKTGAEKNAEKEKQSADSNTKLKTLAPVDSDGNIKGTEIPAKPKLEKIPAKFRQEVNTQLGDLLGEVDAEEKRAEGVVLKDMGLNSKDELKDDAQKEDFKARMKKENKPPNLNLCKVSIPGTNLYCGENKGLKRDEMPQFKGKPVKGKPAEKMQADPKTGLVDVEGLYREHLKKKGINISEPTEVPPESLKATQNELVGAQVVSMTRALEKDPENEFLTAPIYVSRDGYVVDGHHRWAAITGYNLKNPDKPIPMKVMVIDDDIENVIPDAIEFADGQGIERMAGQTAGKDMNKDKKPAVAEKKNISLVNLLKARN